MRLGVLDVGSNTVHLLIVDAHPGAAPSPVRSVKSEVHLSELIGADGALGPEGLERLVSAVGAAGRAARDEGVEDLVAFATSAVREASDSAELLEEVRRRADVDLVVLPGEDEAVLTFLAVRRWFGWSAGRMLCLDIGGGSLELAVGTGEVPEVARSVPLGAGRLTRERLTGDPPSGASVRALRTYVRSVLADLAPVLRAQGPVDRGVATSKTFRSLARIAGAAPSDRGPLVPRRLSRADVGGLVDLLSTLTVADRVRLPGVSPSRAGQLLAGAVVAHEAMLALDLDVVSLCPWAMREGVILRRLDWLAGSEQGLEPVAP